MKRYLMIILLMLLLPAAVSYAQDTPPDDITNAIINYGDIVTDTITPTSIYDWWKFPGNQGEVVRIQMVAADGLAPLIGISEPGGTIIARSDQLPDGGLVDAPVNGTAELIFTVPSDSEYTIVATRAGNIDGTTTGSYTLSLTLDSTVPTKELQDVVFRCDQYEITTAATVEFGGEGDDGDYYRFTVYGLDGFQPYLRFNLPINGGSTTCSSQGDGTTGDVYVLPGTDPVTVSQGSPYTAQHILQGMRDAGRLTLTLGSRSGEPGRYAMLIEGYNISPAGDEDVITVRLGPLAATTTMQVYMLRRDGRIDPQIQMLDEDPVIDFTCDDAGRRACADLPSGDQYRFTLSDGTVVTGERLDAGVEIATGNPNRVELHFRSRTATTDGAYTILILGELPPRAAPAN